nr:hypothetical protein [Tanacetum cinerariifolium]
QRPDGIFINQDKYVQEILNKFDLGSVRTATTPYEATKPKSKNEADSLVNVYMYRSMIESPLVLEAYCDSDYVRANKDRKSTTGGCQFLGKRLIPWQCKKQTIVATSSTEAEYVAAANCCGQIKIASHMLRAFAINNPKEELNHMHHMKQMQMKEWKVWLPISEW